MVSVLSRSYFARLYRQMLTSKRLCYLMVFLAFLMLIAHFCIPALKKYYFIYHHDVPSNDLKRVPVKEKTILFWTDFFGSTDFGVGIGSGPFSTCPVSQCRTTDDKSLLNQSDAVIFHIPNLHEVLPLSRRLPHQRWIFFILESPVHTQSLRSVASNSFNWTMTYRADSDIYAPYAVDGPSHLDWQSVDYKYIYNTPNRTELWVDLPRRKTKKVAWFVSHCYTSGRRERYVAQLQKYISVDIYGICGPLQCSRFSPGNQCHEMLEKDYKFYLAFENSLCRDYITEKFYLALLYNVVPVVYGGANYTNLAPKKSFIDIRDFKSPRHLAEYLNYLDKNDEEYLKYFEWRRTPPGVSALPKGHQPWCNLCQMLHDPKLPTKSYANITAWWFDQGQCDKDRPLIDKQLTAAAAKT